MDGQELRHDISSSCLWPVELKTKQKLPMITKDKEMREILINSLLRFCLILDE